LLSIVHAIFILHYGCGSESHHSCTSKSKGILLWSISQCNHLLLQFLALFFIVSLLSQVIKHVLHIILALCGLAIMIIEGELPHILLFEHISLSECAHRYNSIILHRPYSGHFIHCSCENDGNVSLLDVPYCLDNVFMSLPLCYLHKLELF